MFCFATEGVIVSHMEEKKSEEKETKIIIIFASIISELNERMAHSYEPINSWVLPTGQRERECTAITASEDRAYDEPNGKPQTRSVHCRGERIDWPHRQKVLALQGCQGEIILEMHLRDTSF